MPVSCECGALTWEPGPNGALVIEGTGTIRVQHTADDRARTIWAACYTCGEVEVQVET